MPGFNPERINIKDLTIEEPEKYQESTFDPERDITPEHWEAMKQSVKKDLSSGQTGLARGKVREMRILFPERVDELPLTKELWDGNKDSLDTDIHYGGVPVSQFRRWDMIADEAAGLKILFPERFSEIQLSEEIWDGLIKKMEFWQDWMVKNNNAAGRDLIRMAIDVKIIDPDNKELSKISEDIELRKVMVDWAKNRKGKKAWFDFIPLCATIKILFPEAMDELLDTETWNNLRAFIKSKETEEHWTSMKEYESLKILAAKEIKFTDKGIEFTMPEKKEAFDWEAPQLPEKRTF